MIIKVFHIIAVFFCLIQTIKSEEICSAAVSNVKIICNDVRIRYFRVVGEMLACCHDGYDKDNNPLIPFISLLPDVQVEEQVIYPNGTELENKADIKAFWIEDGNVRFIPKGFMQAFPNLRVLAIEVSGLMSVSRDDFEQFGTKLEWISLFKNKLTSLEANIFDKNPNLRQIYLSYNNFKYIDPRFFVNLKKLNQIEQVAIWAGNCIDQEYFKRNDGSIASFEWENSKCIDDIGTVESTLWPIHGRVQQSLKNEKCLKYKLETTVIETIKNDNSNAQDIIGKVDEFLSFTISRLNTIENNLNAMKFRLAEHQRQKK